MSRTVASPEPFGLRFSTLGVEQVVDKLTHENAPAGQGAQLMVTANVDHIVQRAKNAAFAAAYRSAFLVTADGMPVYLFARLMGASLPGRVTGADVFAALMPRLDPMRHRPFFVAATPAIGDALKSYFCSRGFAPEAVGIASPAPGFDASSEASAALAAAIRSFGPTHLVFGLGAPKSEIWVHQHCDQLGDCFVLSVGAAAEFFIGAKRRAPKLCQAAGLEWLWRLASEPQRLWRRYLIGSWSFANIVRREILAQIPAGRSTA